MKLNTRELCQKFAEDPMGAGTSGGAAHYAAGVFYSYATPIAKVTPKGAWVAMKRYSVTTSKHQTWVGGALRRAGYDVKDCEVIS